jgi:hypothetical protein
MTHTEFRDKVLADTLVNALDSKAVDVISSTDILLRVVIDGKLYRILRTTISDSVATYYVMDNHFILHRVIDCYGNVIPIWNNISPKLMVDRLMYAPFNEHYNNTVYQKGNDAVIYSIVNFNEYWIIVLGGDDNPMPYYTTRDVINLDVERVPAWPVLRDGFVYDNPFAEIVDPITRESRLPDRVGMIEKGVFDLWADGNFPCDSEYSSDGHHKDSEVSSVYPLFNGPSILTAQLLPKHLIKFTYADNGTSCEVEIIRADKYTKS